MASTVTAAQQLVDELGMALSPASEILTSGPVFAAASTDESGILRDVPLCVIRPDSASDVCAIVKFCRQHSVPIVPRGGGTGLEGGSVPVGRCVVLDTSSLDSIIKISPDDRTAYVGCGVTAERLNSLIAEHGLFYATAPAGSAESATIGGLISTNAKGMYSLRYGGAAASLLGVEVVMADGSRAFFGHHVHQSSSGLDMKSLFAGAEGTLGIIVSAIVRLHPVPAGRTSLVAGFTSLNNAARLCSDVAAWIPDAAAIEIVSTGTVQSILKVLPDCGLPVASLVMIEVHADLTSAETAVAAIRELVSDHGGFQFIPASAADHANPWNIRHRFTGIISEQSQAGHPFRFDAAVPTSMLETYVSGLERYAGQIRNDSTGGSSTCRITCIFGHAGAGIVHVLLPTGDRPEQWSPAQAAELKAHAVKAALALGGTVSGEHGIGLTSINEAAIENAESLRWMKAVKTMMDPTGIMNPGKILG